ncbi:hypothetical protein ABBQ32_011114 [Trebouxia sp. C0010 RCD-2024]
MYVMPFWCSLAYPVPACQYLWCVDPSSEAPSASAAYAAVPFVYDTSEAREAQALAPAASPAIVVDTVPDVAFVPNFAVPSSVQAHLPKFERMHKIILQTAKFVRHAGGQTEFVLRVKQAANPNFKFLEPHDQQHPYFRWLVNTKPEDMMSIDAAPSAVLSSSAHEASPVTAAGSHDSGPPTVPTSVVQQPSVHEELPQSAVTAQASTAALPPTAATHAANATTEESPAQPPALPVADMQALAKRIGMAQPAPAQPSNHGPKLITVPDRGLGIQPPQAVNSPGAVPYEIQAIVQKLVHFIKKAGPRFEATVRNKEKANPRFAFLLPWNQHHAYYRQQLVEVLGEATADEVIALRAASVPEAPQAQLGAGTVPAQQATPATPSKASDAQASEAAADDLHHQADAVIPAGSQLAQSLAVTNSDDSERSQGNGADRAVSGSDEIASRSAATDADVLAEADQQDGGASSTAGDADQQGPEPADSSYVGASGRMAPPGVTVLRSNPRFASRPLKSAPDADSPAADKPKGDLATAEESVQQHEIASPGLTSQPSKRRQDRQEPDAQLHPTQEPEAAVVLRQEQAGQPARQQVQRAQEQQHAAHAAAFSLEAVMEAQSALVHERHRNPQPNMTEDEKKAHRRRLVRQMLEAKQKSQAEAEEEKRKMQQEALAKYRQAFASDAEEEVIHMKLEDDETYEAPEPGEIVDEPEGKPVSGPVLNAPPPSPLPTLEALIKPRQDLVPQQRVFPLPSSSTQQSNQRNDRGGEAGTGSLGHSSNSAESAGRARRRHRHRHKRSRSSSGNSHSHGRRTTRRHKHRRRSRSSSGDSQLHLTRKQSRKHKRSSRQDSDSRRSGQSSKRSKQRRSPYESSQSESGSQDTRKRRHRDTGSSAESGGGVEDAAEALRAKIRAVLGGL